MPPPGARDALRVENAQCLGHRLELRNAGVEASGVDGSAEDGVDVAEELVAGVEGDESRGAPHEVGPDGDAQDEEEDGRAGDDLGDRRRVGAIAKELGAIFVHLGELQVDRSGGHVAGQPLAVLAQKLPALDGAEEANLGEEFDRRFLRPEEWLRKNGGLEERAEAGAEDVADGHVAEELAPDFVEVDSGGHVGNAGTFGDDVGRHEVLLLVVHVVVVCDIVVVVVIHESIVVGSKMSFFGEV